jgi:transcriptional regulator GlxA family with amidase domain
MSSHSRIRSVGVDVGRPTPAEKTVAEPAEQPFASTPLVRERRLRKVLQSIESRLPHSIRELAHEVSLSPAHLQRLFKQETGVHLSDLLSERRLQMAAHMLCSTHMEIKEIAYAVGYGHHSSFVRAFERRFNQSPKQYRQKVMA